MQGHCGLPIWAGILAGNPNDPNWIADFVKQAVTILTSDNSAKVRKQVQGWATKRFKIENILEQWEKVFENG